MTLFFKIIIRISLYISVAKFDDFKQISSISAQSNPKTAKAKSAVYRLLIDNPIKICSRIF